MDQYTYLGHKDSEHEGYNKLQAASGFHDHNSGSEGESGGTTHEGSSSHYSIGGQTDWQGTTAAPHNGSYNLSCYSATCIQPYSAVLIQHVSFLMVRYVAY